jgi:hypothetical protein
MMQEELEHPKSFTCPISFELMRDPVMLGTTGHTYEREVIKKCLRGRRRNPLTNEDLRRDECFLIPNRTLKQAIAEYCQRRNIPWGTATTDTEEEESDEEVFTCAGVDAHVTHRYDITPTTVWIPGRQLFSHYFSHSAHPNPESSINTVAGGNVEESLGEEGIDPRDILLVIDLAHCTRNAAVRALRNYDNDLVLAIMELTF